MLIGMTSNCQLINDKLRKAPTASLGQGRFFVTFCIKRLDSTKFNVVPLFYKCIATVASLGQGHH